MQGKQCCFQADQIHNVADSGMNLQAEWLEQPRKITQFAKSKVMLPQILSGIATAVWSSSRDWQWHLNIGNSADASQWRATWGANLAQQWAQISSQQCQSYNDLFVIAFWIAEANNALQLFCIALTNHHDPNVSMSLCHWQHAKKKVTLTFE